MGIDGIAVVIRQFHEVMTAGEDCKKSTEIREVFIVGIGIDCQITISVVDVIIRDAVCLFDAFLLRILKADDVVHVIDVLLPLLSRHFSVDETCTCIFRDEIRLEAHYHEWQDDDEERSQ